MRGVRELRVGWVSPLHALGLIAPVVEDYLAGECLRLVLLPSDRPRHFVIPDRNTLAAVVGVILRACLLMRARFDRPFPKARRKILPCANATEDTLHLHDDFSELGRGQVAVVISAGPGIHLG